MHADTETSRADHALLKPTLAELGGDLTTLAPHRVAWSLTIPFLCAAGFAAFASLGWWFPAVACVVLLSFFSYGSVSHDLVHNTLGLPHWANHVCLCTIELLSIRSGHAYRLAHLNHHASFPSAEDVEAFPASHGFWRAILDGPLMTARVTLWAMRQRGPHKMWVAFESVACVMIVAVATYLARFTLTPVIYISLCIAGSWVFPLVTVWVPHDRHGKNALTQTKLFRGRIAAIIAMQHLYHLEHHLYPGVPHHHWPALAARLDPYFQRAGVRPIRLFS